MYSVIRLVVSARVWGSGVGGGPALRTSDSLGFQSPPGVIWDKFWCNSSNIALDMDPATSNTLCASVPSKGWGMLLLLAVSATTLRLIVWTLPP